MLTQKQSQERGQAILLMAVAMVGMLGFAAVALDGGNIYAEQRRAQSAADNAVLAGAYQYMRGITSSTTISNSALANAALNDYDNNSTSNWVKFYRPPITGAYVGNTSYMQVVITERVPTALAHLVYQGPFQLTVNAVAYAKTGGPPVSGNAIVALAKTGCSIVESNGNGGMVVSGGGIFANSDATGCGNGGSVIDAAGNGSSVTVDPPYGISVVATTNASGGSGTISPTVATGASQITTDPLADLDPPNCGASKGSAPHSGSIGPGSYTDIDATGNLTLQPGIYCITSSSNHAVDIGPSGVLSGTGIMLYFQYGGMSIQGAGPTLNISAPSVTRNPECANLPTWNAPNTSVCHYVGMVIYADRNNTSDIKLEGSAGWSIDGTIYAPASLIELDGRSRWTMTGQVLGNTVVSGGGGGLDVHFDPTVIYSPPPTVTLEQ